MMLLSVFVPFPTDGDLSLSEAVKFWDSIGNFADTFGLNEMRGGE